MQAMIVLIAALAAGSHLVAQGQQTASSFVWHNPSCINFRNPLKPVFLRTATACEDILSSRACTAMFGPPIDNTTGRANSIACEDRSTFSLGDVVSSCPKHCGMCCLTPTYNCANAPSPRVNCDVVTKEMCEDRYWKDVVATDCPGSCGLCLFGGCMDMAPDCETQVQICTNDEARAARICRRTCGYCTPGLPDNGTLPTGAGFTLNPVVPISNNNNGNGTVPSSVCATDADPKSCPTWAAKGFCTSYSLAKVQSRCARSCGLPCA